MCTLVIKMLQLNLTVESFAARDALFQHSYSKLEAIFEDLHVFIKNLYSRGRTIDFERRLIFNFGNSPLQIRDIAKAFVT